jgi:hypothetical protein
MLVVSHDRRFLDTVCDRLWVVDDGAVAPFDGGYRAWRAAVAAGWTVASALEQEAKRLRPVAGAPRTAKAPAAGPMAAGPAAGSAPPPEAGAASRASVDGANGTGTPARVPRGPKLSKDAYRRQRETMDSELTRLGLRRNHLELELSAGRQANFIELRRVSSELADVEVALAAAEDAWLALEERAP